jgi:hypothetical protein
LQLPSRVSVSLPTPTRFLFSPLSFAAHATKVVLLLLIAMHFLVRLSVPGSRPVD